MVPTSDGGVETIATPETGQGGASQETGNIGTQQTLRCAPPPSQAL